MTTYAEFKDFFTRSIWREGDTAFAQDFDQLVLAAEARIRRDTRLNDLEKQAELTIGSSNSAALPSDYLEAVSVNLGDGMPSMLPATLQEVHNKKAILHETAEYRRDLYGFSPIYAISAKTIYLPTKFDDTNPGTLYMTYRYSPVPYAMYDEQSGDPSYYDEFPDFYIAALKVQTYDYFRDFDLSSEANGKYKDLLESMREDQIKKQFPGGPIDAPLPGIVA